MSMEEELLRQERIAQAVAKAANESVGNQEEKQDDWRSSPMAKPMGLGGGDNEEMNNEDMLLQQKRGY